MSDDHQLLVVGATQSHALVEKDLAAGLVHLFSKMAVLFGAESEPIEVGAPDQSLDYHSAPGGSRQHQTDLCVGAGSKTLVRVAAPVGEVELIPVAQPPNHFQQPTEVGRSMDQDLDQVPAAPRVAIATAAVKLGEIVSSLRASQEPAVENIVRHGTKIPLERLSAAEGVTAIVTSFGPSSLA